MIFNVLGGLWLIVLMVLFSGVAVDALEKIVARFKVNQVMLVTILLGLSTALPEIFIGLSAAVKSQPEIALGVVTGSILANLSWIIGGAAVMAGVIPVIGEYFHRNLWVTLGLAMAPFVLMVDGTLSRVDGVFLIALYILYVNYTLENKKAPVKTYKLIKRNASWVKEMTILLFSVVVLSGSGWLLVSMAQSVSLATGLNLYWIGLIIISIGTTLPELVLSIVGAQKNKITLVLGDILGSVVINSTLILGLVALLNPIRDPGHLQKGVSGVFLVVVLGIFWLFTKSKHKLERWEGLVLVGIYAMFLGLQLMLA